MEIGFLDLNPVTVSFLFLVGFVGGLVSGFIGSGGAFVLTPAMMSMGVPAIVAVASNMCHKFPKALVGAMKRAKYGQVDVKLGIIMGVSAELGVLVGAHVQETIREAFDKAGSNLYVSAVFVVVLAIVGGVVLRDAWNMHRSANPEHEETARLARWVQSIHIPGTMMYFKSIGTSISVLFTIPLGFATGMLAATIAVGGFIGVPAMMYLLGVPGLMASATELVIAFVMGMGGSIKYAWGGFVDIRLAMIILAGSLFGVQLGAIGTTYVKPYMIKMVMGVIMILVLLSRGIMIPVYLANLDVIEHFSSRVSKVLENLSFATLILALATGGLIILTALWRGRRAHEEAEAMAAAAFTMPVAAALKGSELSPLGRFERILLVTDGSEFTAGATRESIRIASRCEAQLYAMSVVVSNPEYESLAPQLLEKEEEEALRHLEQVKSTAEQAGLSCEVLVKHGAVVHQEIVDEADRSQMDVIVMGRRGKSGLMRVMMGSTTAKVIGHTDSSVLVVPRAARIEAKSLLLAVDGSRHSDAAAAAAANLAQHCAAPVTVVCVAASRARLEQAEARAIAKRVTGLLTRKGVRARGEVLTGRPAEAIVDAAQSKGSDLIILGSHGRTGLERILLGSVSERVIGHASCAVLVVRL